MENCPEETIQIKDKTFKPYMSKDEIANIVSRLGQELSKDYLEKDPIFIAILNGAFIFAADLMKMITIPCSISFIKVSSYQGTQSSNKLKDLIGLNENIQGRHVVVVEDIIDTGFSMEYVLAELKGQGAASVKLCSLLFKPSNFKKEYKIDYIGKSIPNDFVVGYGFDYDGYGRNIPCIYQISE